MDAVPFGAITLLDLAACGRRGLFYKKFLGVFRRSFSVGAAHWAARLVFCLLGCFAVPSCFSLSHGGRLFCRRKGAGGSADTLLLVFRCRWLGGNRGPGTPLFESAFVAAGLKCGSGKRRIRATLRFSRRARCPHRAVLGRPGVPPLRRESKPDSASGTGDREGRPYGFTRAYSKPWRAGLGPAPTADTESRPFCRRGRFQAGPREGHTPGWLLSSFGRFTFSPSPTGFKGIFQVLGRGVPWGSRRG